MHFSKLNYYKTPKLEDMWSILFNGYVINELSSYDIVNQTPKRTHLAWFQGFRPSLKPTATKAPVINIPVPTVSVLTNYFSKSIPWTICIRITGGGKGEAGLKCIDRFSGLVTHPPIWTLGGWNLKIHISKSPKGLSCWLEFETNSKGKLLRRGC